MDGTSIDPRFQCSRLPYDCWVEKITKFPPANKRPEEPGVSIWWDTAIGIIYHQISVDEENRQTLRRNPGNERDIWYSATRLWPELEAADFDQLVCGHVTKEADGTFTMYYMPAWTGCQRVDFSIKRQQEILSWLRLPPETEVLEAGF